MSEQDAESRPKTESLGSYLKNVRAGLGLTLRDVEEGTDRQVSNAYLSQLENGKIAKPSPNILHALASLYGVSYAGLMQRAGYVSPAARSSRGRREKHGRAATFSVENLTADEEAELLRYLAWYRSNRSGS